MSAMLESAKLFFDACETRRTWRLDADDVVEGLGIDGLASSASGCGDIYLLFSDKDYFWVAALFALLGNLAWSQSSIGLNELMNHRC